MVGMENHIEKLNSLLEVNSNDVRIVGIHGMGGLGKTTMAKIIYNQLCQQFEGHCFLENIRENSNPQEKIVNLQSQLISKIQNRRAEQFIDFNEGCRRIKEAVRRKKLLIVLDDADEKFQIDMLIGEGSCFGLRSRIIITTRNKSVLNSIEKACQREDLHYVYASYEPEFMDELHSLQLFSKYAFRRDFPFEEYNFLSKKIVSIAAGLPLVLVVLGSTFSEVEGIDLWEENVRKLREIPNGEVIKKLRFSFEALSREEKEIFLDIACLFIGKNAEICSYMWDDCNYYPKNAINTLTNKSLVNKSSTNEFKMHDQLRDLGRHIVDEKELGNRSRLWREEEVLDVLKSNQGTTSISASCLPGHYEGNSLAVPLSGVRLKKLVNLRYLRLGFQDIDGDFTCLLSKLRWLQWKCVGTFKPRNLHMENLVVLDLSFSSFTDDWDGWNQINFGKKLKHLDLSFCKGIGVLGPFSKCTSLESLNLRHLSVCRLDVLGVFKALKYLSASECENLETLSGLEKLESLQDLSIERCTSLKKLSDLSNLKMLKNFNGCLCKKLIEIVGLEKLVSLQTLNLVYCESLESLPNVSKLKNLKRFEVQGCSKLIKVDGIHKLNALEFLDVWGCVSLTKFPNIFNLDNLTYLSVSRLELELAVKGTCLKKLKRLEIYTCDENTIQFLCGLESLEYLYIAHCKKLVKIQGLDKLRSLIMLFIDNCPCLESLSDLPNFGTLKDIQVSGCNKLRDVAALGVVESLENLVISSCDVLREIPDLQNRKSLKKLRISYLTEPTEVRTLKEIQSLESLEIKRCCLMNTSNIDGCKKSIHSGHVDHFYVEGVAESNGYTSE